MSKSKPEVAVLMGSNSDWLAVKSAVDVLEKFGVACEVRVISAHRTPSLAASYASTAARRGIKVLIAAAGGAAHLAGVLAAHTVLPVIGVPVGGGSLNGLDALLATVQMPAGVPVATVALGSAGPLNAAILAIEILAVHRPELARKLVRHKRELAGKVEKGDAKVQSELAAMRNHERGARK